MRKNAKSTKHRKTRGFLALPGGSAAGAAALLSYGEERNAFGNATARGPLAGFKRLRATADQGAQLCWAHLVAICWPMLAYVGLSCRQRGPILWLCWPMFASCWPMLSQKIRKMGTAKKRCKTHDTLMVGGLSWGYVGPILGLCWPILRAMWAHLGAILAHLRAMLAHLGAMLAHLGAMLAHLEAYVGPS